MRKIRAIHIIFFFLLAMENMLASKDTYTDSLLNRLDSIIEHREVYIGKKEQYLDSLRRQFFSSRDDNRRFDLAGELFGSYHSYNADSAYIYSTRQEEIARRIGDYNKLLNARINKANVYNITGMYHEALSLLDSINYSELPDYLRAYYFHAKRTLYGYLTDYAVFGTEKAYYAELTDQYRDSILSVNQPGTMFWVLIKADQLNELDKPREAIDLMENFIKNNALGEHETAIFAWTLSGSYEKIGDEENQKKYVLLSAISDMQSAAMEYISLRKLALILYKEGDLDRAYRLMTIAVNDAARCNARQRIVELSAYYPTVNDIYFNAVHSQKRKLEYTIIIITVMAVALVVVLLCMRKQMRRLADSRRQLEEANGKLNDMNGQLSASNSRLNELVGQLSDSNERLNELNVKLHESNRKLHEANCAITEISQLKEVYIGKYMDQSLEYIELFDGYRKQIGKLLGAGKIDDLRKMVKSSAIIDDEFKAFYDQFDKTFLNLFPTFVEDFNRLLLPGEEIFPKKAGCLNTELRIFALIRLGVSDSDKIAKFLRYSLSTIYNYRTKVRNKARGDRNLLEAEVAKIGKLSV